MISVRCGRIRLKNDTEGFYLLPSYESAVSEISGRPGIPPHSKGWDLEKARGSKGQSRTLPLRLSFLYQSSAFGP